MQPLVRFQEISPPKSSVRTSSSNNVLLDSQFAGVAEGDCDGASVSLDLGGEIGECDGDADTNEGASVDELGALAVGNPLGASESFAVGATEGP